MRATDTAEDTAEEHTVKAQLLVTSFHSHHTEHGYDGNFFGVKSSESKHITSGSKLLFSWDNSNSTAILEVQTVTREMKHEGKKTGQRYIYINFVNGAPSLREMMGRPLMPGDNVAVVVDPKAISFSLGSLFMKPKDFSKRWDADLQEMRDDGIVVGPVRKLLHAFVLFQSIVVAGSYIGTSVLLFNNWIITQDMQLAEGVYLLSPNPTQLAACIEKEYGANFTNGTHPVRYYADCVNARKRYTHYNRNCKCKTPSPTDNPCLLEEKNFTKISPDVLFTFNITDLDFHLPDGQILYTGLDGEGPQLYMRAKAGYQYHINRNDTACWVDKGDDNPINKAILFCAMITISLFSLLLAFLEFSKTFAPIDHTVHLLDLKFVATVRYYLIEQELRKEDGSVSKRLLSRLPHKGQEVAVKLAQYFFTVMIYNCMLACFTKPGDNFMGNNDAIFSTDENAKYIGPGIWRTSSSKLIMYFLQGSFTFLMFLIVLTGVINIPVCIIRRRLNFNFPLGPMLFILCNIVAFVLLANQIGSYSYALYKMQVPSLNLTDFIFGISLDWPSFTFRVPDIQMPVAVLVFTIGSLNTSLLITRIIEFCRKTSRIVPEALANPTNMLEVEETQTLTVESAMSDLQEAAKDEIIGRAKEEIQEAAYTAIDQALLGETSKQVQVSVSVTAFHPHHLKHGYDGNFFGIEDSASKRILADQRLLLVDSGGVSTEVCVWKVTEEMEHDGQKTGQIYVYINFEKSNREDGANGASSLRELIGRALMPGDNVTLLTERL